MAGWEGLRWHVGCNATQRREDSKYVGGSGRVGARRHLFPFSGLDFLVNRGLSGFSVNSVPVYHGSGRSAPSISEKTRRKNNGTLLNLKQRLMDNSLRAPCDDESNRIHR